MRPTESDLMTEEIRFGRRTPARVATALALTAASLAAALFAPLQAGAITRDEIIARAQDWVDRNVQYSQSRTFEGYRTDCSGFVSMAWTLDHSYTSRSIGSRATRIDIDELLPGDAVHVPGHVSIFAGWANAERTSYIALEESNSRNDAREAVRAITRGTTALRLNGVEEPVPEKTAAEKHAEAVEEHTSLPHENTASELLASLSVLVSDRPLPQLDAPAESKPVGLTALPRPVGG